MASKTAAAESTPSRAGAPPEGPRRRVYPFSRAGSEGTIEMKSLLGGKGAGLCAMGRLGLNVPPGFVISTEVCARAQEVGGALPPGLWEEVEEALKGVEGVAGAKFGDAAAPLLLSVRSGAALSMPGMMVSAATFLTDPSTQDNANPPNQPTNQPLTTQIARRTRSSTWA
jgi:hypothetical protein